MSSLRLFKNSVAVICVGISAFLVSWGLRQITMAFAVSSESIKWLPASLFHISDILTSLSLLAFVVIGGICVARLTFAFSRYMEVRVGYTQIPQTDYPVLNSGAGLSKLISPTEPKKSLAEGGEQHRKASILANSSARRANRRGSIGNISYPNTESILDNGREAMASINHSLRDTISDRPQSDSGG